MYQYDACGAPYTGPVQQSWFGVPTNDYSNAGYMDDSWGEQCGWGNMLDNKGSMGRKGKGKGKGKGESASKNSAVCKFFLEGRCTRGESCAFSHTRPPPETNGAEEDPHFDAEMQDAFRQMTGNGRAEGKGDGDAQLMEMLAAEAEAAERIPPKEDDDPDAGDALPPPATEEEVEEARNIVMKAQREAIEREKMKEKAKTANFDDLQAMINARLKAK
mmetsp:Transcript_113529/g.212705  ORF Transcript_113529/g.212705 Transcript_113529/m.212705 type:complete len:217 (+) Transcript_113529:69-719(+)